MQSHNEEDRLPTSGSRFWEYAHEHMPGAYVSGKFNPCPQCGQRIESAETRVFRGTLECRVCKQDSAIWYTHPCKHAVACGPCLRPDAPE